MNNAKIEVSVTIATYCHEKYIRQCLDSVFSQETDFDYEVIVAEDASPDNTRQILLEYKEKYGDQLVLILHDKNLGPSRNSASIRPYIQGKYIACVEGDDCWVDKHKLQKQYDILEKHSEYSAVCCDYMTIDTSGSIVIDKNLNLRNDSIKTMDNWLNEPYSLHTCTIFRRNIYPNDNPEYVKLRLCAPTMGDLISFSVLYDYGPIYVLKDVMAAHRAAGLEDTTSFSKTSAKEPLKYAKMFIDIFSNIEAYFNYKYDFTKRKCIKLAFVKLGKLLKHYNYNSKDMREIVSQFSLKWRIYIIFRTCKEFCSAAMRKAKRMWRK